MSLTARFGLALALLPALGMPAYPQGGDRAALFSPLRPRTRQELNRREALKLYVDGLICQKQDRLLEAVGDWERALRLDPEAAPVLKALVPLYRALERPEDALAACRKAVRLDPADPETWFHYARLLKARGEAAPARDALTRGLACAGLQEQPELRQQMCFELGALCEGARDFPRAVDAFTEAARILDRVEALPDAGPFDPREVAARAADLYERIGRLCVQARQYDRAVKAFEKAQARAGDRAGRLNYNLAEVCRAQGKYDKALGFLNGYLRLQPQGLEPYELKIELLKRLGREKEILPSLDAYARADRFNVGLQLLRAREYAAEGQPDQAEVLYRKLLDGEATAEAYRGLFRLYQDSKRMAQVLALLDRAMQAADRKERTPRKTAAARQARVMLAVLKDDPKMVASLLAAAKEHLKDGGTLGYETARLLAVLAGRANRLKEAEAFYRYCLDGLNDQNETAVYAGLLNVLWQEHKYEAVVEVARQGLRGARATSHLMFHYDLSRALACLDRTDEALAHADEAVKLAGDTNRLLMRRQRVAILIRAERYDRAAAECRALLKEYHQPAEVHDIRYTLSGVYQAAHDTPKAERELKRLIRDFPEDATAYNDLGYLWADQGRRLGDAEAYIRKAIELDRRQKKANPEADPAADLDNAAYVDSLGWVLFRRGRVEDARKELEKAVSLADGDDDPVMWDHLGDVYYKLDEPGRARRAWRKALTLFEVAKQRKMDQRYKDIKHKLETLGPEQQPR